MIAAAVPSPLWFATRGAGTATLLLLTGVVALGVVTAGSAARSRIWPRFVSAELHRNLSLFTVVFLLAHVVTAVADPYAKLGWRDAAIPFVSAYRPFWLGLGVIAAELLLALVVSSALRPFLGFRAWKTVHWLAYASWPVAIFHSLGTGTDAPATWSVALVVACTLTVVAAVAWRIGPAAGREGRRASPDSHVHLNLRHPHRPPAANDARGRPRPSARGGRARPRIRRGRRVLTDGRDPRGAGVHHPRGGTRTGPAAAGAGGGIDAARIRRPRAISSVG